MLKTRMWLGIVCCLLWCAGITHADIETRLKNTVTLDQNLVDLDVSAESGIMVCLTDQGQVLVYDSEGVRQGRLDVGPGCDKVRIGPGDDSVYVSTGKKGTVRVFDLAFIQNIHVEGSPFQGPSDAPVVLVMFMDFQCPYCVKLHNLVDDLRKEYPKDLKVVLKHFPLSSHKFAMKAAQASLAAMEQGKFWEYYTKINADYRDLTDAKFNTFRDELDLDKARFDKMMNATETIEKIKRDKTEGIAVGVKATPTVFVNGRLIRPLSADSLKDAIENILAGKKK